MKIKSIVTGALGLLGSAMFSFGEAELGGYCPVCYVSAGQAVKGEKDFKLGFNGKTYYFVKPGARAEFMKNPEKFMPAYDGYCAYGLSLGKKIKADPSQFTIVDGVIYLSSSADVRDRFEVDIQGFITAANAKWQMVMDENQ